MATRWLSVEQAATKVGRSGSWIRKQLTKLPAGQVQEALSIRGSAMFQIAEPALDRLQQLSRAAKKAKGEAPVKPIPVTSSGIDPINLVILAKQLPLLTKAVIELTLVARDLLRTETAMRTIYEVENREAEEAARAYNSSVESGRELIGGSL